MEDLNELWGSSIEVRCAVDCLFALHCRIGIDTMHQARQLVGEHYTDAICDLVVGEATSLAESSSVVEALLLRAAVDCEQVGSQIAAVEKTFVAGISSCPSFAEDGSCQMPAGTRRYLEFVFPIDTGGE